MDKMTRDAWVIISTGIANALVSAGLAITLFLRLRAELQADIADLRSDTAALRTEKRADIGRVRQWLIGLEVIVERGHPPLIALEPSAPPALG